LQEPITMLLTLHLNQRRSHEQITTQRIPVCVGANFAKGVRLMAHPIKKTRKDHECGICGGIIKKGSRAEYENTWIGKRRYLHPHPYRECEERRNVKSACSEIAFFLKNWGKPRSEMMF
jgi:hypothetical protein